MQLVVATPIDSPDVWSGRVTFGYAENLRALDKELTIKHVVGYSQDVVRARNRIAATVLREMPDATHVLWWDEDQWPQRREIVREMIALNLDFVGAPYTNKRTPVRWVHRLLDPSPPEMNGLQEVQAVGFGFTLTSTRCLRAMVASQRRYTDYPHPHKIANIFGQVYEKWTDSDDEEEDALVSEDNGFCNRWCRLGGKIYLYTKGGLIFHAGSRSFSATDIPGAVE